MNTAVIERARKYLARIPGAVSGSGGHSATFHVACILVNGFALSLAEAFPLLQEWNAKCQPPWSDADLRHKLADAERAKHDKPLGWLLEQSRPHPLARPSVKPARLLAPATGILAPTPLPDLTGFGRPSNADLRRINEGRKANKGRPFDLGESGLLWAADRGVLVVGSWHDSDCWGMTDQSGRVLELRRMDGEPFPAIPGTAFDERKSHAVKHSQKAWPVGIMEGKDYPCIALIEGGADFLSGHYRILVEQGELCHHRNVSCAPVAMLSSCPAIHEEALPLFAGKHVRLFPHADKSGFKGGHKWEEQLRNAGAACVDVFDFGPYTTSEGKAVCDLWEFMFNLNAAGMANLRSHLVMPGKGADR